MIRVLADGCFDCLHIGHVEHLRAARMLGDTLIVALTSDEFVNKGEGRPCFPWGERANMLRALKCVDRVIFTDTGPSAIRLIKPNIYVKGKEYEGRLPEEDLVKSLGGRVVFLDTTPIYSSTAILNGSLLRDRVDRTRFA
jgi:rfaE bifunctional protein nucleotidyltransferase chain/domain